MAKSRQRHPAAAPSADRLPLRAAAVGLLLVAGLALAACAWWRPLDGDEGYYAAAAGLWADGALPYRDFFYPQAPLLPPLYAAVVELFGPSLRALRFFSAALGLASVIIWWRWLAASWPRRPGLVLAALLLVAVNPHVLSWTVTVKTYALTGLAVTAALAALARGCRSEASGRWLIAAGLALGLAGATRLLFAPLGPVAAVGLVLWPEAGGRRRGLRAGALLLGGWLLGSAPLAAAWLAAPETFWFNNLGYHELRFSELRAEHPDAGPALRFGVALRDTLRILAVNPFLSGLLALAALGCAGLGRGAPAGTLFYRLTALLAAAFSLVCMLPDPVHAQYFTAPLAILALPLAARGLARLTGSAPRRTALAGVVIVLAAAAVMVLQRPGMSRDPVWSFTTYDLVVGDLEILSAPGDVVFSFWPGYVFGADRQHVPGMENHFAFGVSESLSGPEKARFHIADRHQLERAFGARGPRLVVTGAWMHEVHTVLPADQLRQLVKSFHDEYELAARTGEVRVYKRRYGVSGG